MKSHPHIESLPGGMVKNHLRKLTLSMSLYYPEHERRTESSEFRKTKHELLVVQNLPCWICGSHTKREVHHFYIEWSLQNSVDWAAFILDFPQFAHYPSIEQFVDSPQNMMILCQKHHRHRNYGIHCMDYPEFVIQKFLKQGYHYQAA